MKPDWKDAPEWATHLAMDADGEWYWFDSEPSLNEDGVWNNGKGDSQWAARSYNGPIIETRP